MTLSQPVNMFGVHQATIEDRTTKERFTLRVMGDFANENSEENIPLQGGSQAYPWAVAPGRAEATVNLTVKQYDLNVFKYFSGKNDTTANYTENTSGEAAGYASALANILGSSAFDASTGVASAGVKTSTNPVYGDYIVKAVSATTVDVYLDNNLDGLTFVDDSLKITASPLTVPSGSTVEIPGTNIELTGGSGTIGMSTGDMARFSVRPQNAYNFEYKMGATGASKPEFSLSIFPEKINGNQYRRLYYPRVVANGISFNAAEKEWATFESELMILFDSSLGYAGKVDVVGR